MSIERPLVSVILPVYNGERYLRYALQSVFEQDYRPVDVIVVDDGSTDESAKIAQSQKEIRYIYQSNQGPAAARNTGIDVVQGEYLAFIDADDMWAPNKLNVQIDYLLQHPEIYFTVGRVKNFIEPGIKKQHLINKQVLLQRDFIGLITIVARKEAFAKVGKFNPEYKVASDFEWFTRAKDAEVPMKILPDNLLLRRIHDSNLCIYDTQTVRKNLVRMFKNSIDQRKQKNERGLNKK